MAKVLIVDDEAASLEVVEALVAAEGYQTLCAADGQTALKMVEEQRPDIVLLDIVMPQMNGLEACHRIKTNPLSYATPVIMITALNSQEEKIKAIRAGADDFITKPFDRLQLSARLKSLLRLKIIHDRLDSNLATLREMQREREELMARAVKDIEQPIATIYACLQAVAAEQHLLSPEVAQRIESTVFCVDLVSSMFTDVVNLMRMEQDKLRQAHASLQAYESPPPAAPAA